MTMWWYLHFRIYFFAIKAEKRIMRGGVLIKRIVGSTGGVLDRNSVSFYESRKTSWTTLVRVLHARKCAVSRIADRGYGSTKDETQNTH